MLSGVVLGLNVQRHPGLQNREMKGFDDAGDGLIIGYFSMYSYGWPKTMYWEYEDTRLYPDHFFVHEPIFLPKAALINALLLAAAFLFPHLLFAMYYRRRFIPKP
jgi:hypothetical protein